MFAFIIRRLAHRRAVRAHIKRMIRDSFDRR
jgi:hypothetical protein